MTIMNLSMPPTPGRWPGSVLPHRCLSAARPPALRVCRRGVRATGTERAPRVNRGCGAGRPLGSSRAHVSRFASAMGPHAQPLATGQPHSPARLRMPVFACGPPCAASRRIPAPRSARHAPATFPFWRAPCPRRARPVGAHPTRGRACCYRYAGRPHAPGPSSRRGRHRAS